jgi:hypothetical protein
MQNLYVCNTHIQSLLRRPFIPKEKTQNENTVVVVESAFIFYFRLFSILCLYCKKCMSQIPHTVSTDCVQALRSVIQTGVLVVTVAWQASSYYSDSAKGKTHTQSGGCTLGLPAIVVIRKQKRQQLEE